MRAGLTLGLHRMELNDDTVEVHRCRIYWTVYSLDRSVIMLEDYGLMTPTVSFLGLWAELLMSSAKMPC